MRIFKNDVLSIDPRADTDSRVVETRVRLEDPATAARLIYLQVTIVIGDAPEPASSSEERRKRGLP